MMSYLLEGLDVSSISSHLSKEGLIFIGESSTPKQKRLQAPFIVRG